jgi:hypothetical protein
VNGARQNDQRRLRHPPAGQRRAGR